jgi:hypothetical protein
MMEDVRTVRLVWGMRNTVRVVYGWMGGWVDGHG